ncbi:MAG: hypothetical protein A2408_03565 [Candidatus Yonathbacteria bacterium RIFOXYC1_FULL_52_10]|uniref:Uncharacterized protein n=1 Tax=Candidatus Yonathbacteria bacterium RIFOXYD1_FULL_52_36 TaxID=1802730 RepID=A0A1G2SJ19_9BACT|nr:MAG: hypothetical protein A2408_03565 [Candidatus Yonathbacteria bacterium RIFOXYC1_FULL_52_10]OHA85006.1 MAG: hypothetical protein A2591_02185 [Candidatus Yonathbacteria bacterium RIFOXYD1_FULL_52_36]
MKTYDIVHGPATPEIYSLGFDGKCIQFFVDLATWNDIGSRLKQTGRRLDYVTTSRTLDGSLAINVPVIPSIVWENGPWIELREYARTISTLERILGTLIYESRDAPDTGEPYQLFHVNTYVGKPAGKRHGQWHGGGIDLSVAHSARTHLEVHGGSIAWEEVLKSMQTHHAATFPSVAEEYRYGPASFKARVRERGLLHLHTIGNGVCLGANSDSFSDDEGCYLSGHNVDTVAQQFNLLVGIASVWQAVHKGMYP